MSRHVHVRWSRLVLAAVMAAVLASAAGAARRPHSALDEAERGDRPPDVETVVLRFVHIPAESFLDTLEQLGENEEVGRALEQVPRAVNEPANAVVLIVPPEVAEVMRRVAEELDQPNEFLVHEQEREAEEAALRAEMEERERDFDRDQAEFELEMDRQRLELEKAEAEARLRLEAAKRHLAQPVPPPMMGPGQAGPPQPMRQGWGRRPYGMEYRRGGPPQPTPGPKAEPPPQPMRQRWGRRPYGMEYRRGGPPQPTPGPRAEPPPRPPRAEREHGPRAYQPERLRERERERPRPREAEEREERREAQRRDIDRHRERIHQELQELERSEAELRREHQEHVHREAEQLEERLREVRGNIEELEHKKRDLHEKREHLRREELPPEKLESLQHRIEGALRELQEHQERLHRELEELEQGRKRLHQRAEDSLREHLEGIESRHRQLRRQLEELGEQEAPAEARPPDRPPEGPGRGLPEWLLGPRAREALGLSEEQAARIRDLLGDLREHRERVMRGLREKLRDAGPEGRREMLRNMRERLADGQAEAMRRVRDRLMEILRPEQREKVERWLRSHRPERPDEPRPPHGRHEDEPGRHHQPAGRQVEPLHRLIQDVVVIGGGARTQGIQVFVNGEPMQVQTQPFQGQGGPGRGRGSGRWGQGGPQGRADDPERQERIRQMRVRYLFNMLQDEDLRAEVDLAPMQEREIADLIKRYQEERKRIEHDVRSQVGPQDPGRADPEALERDLRRETASALRDAEPMLNLIAEEAVDVLTEEQKERLQEASRERNRLRMACGDLWILTTKRAIEELGLDAGQRLRIRAILKDATDAQQRRYEAMRDSFRDVPPDQRRGEEMRQRWLELKQGREQGLADTRERIFRVLNPTQREKVEKFLAESKAKAGWQRGGNLVRPGNRGADSRVPPARAAGRWLA